MLIKTRGIVLRAIKYGESGLICDLFTEDFGMTSFLVQGIRGNKSQHKSILLRVGNLVDVVAYHRENKGLQRLTEVRADYVYQDIPFNLTKGSLSLFMAELALKSIRYSESEQALFHFLRNSFIFLDETKGGIGNLHLLFALRLSYYLGFAPQVSVESGDVFFDLREGVFVSENLRGPYTLSAEQSHLLRELIPSSYEEGNRVRMNREVRWDLLVQLIDYFSLHLNHFQGLQSHKILHELLS